MSMISSMNGAMAAGLNNLFSSAGCQKFMLPTVFKICCRFAPSNQGHHGHSHCHGHSHGHGHGHGPFVPYHGHSGPLHPYHPGGCQIPPRPPECPPEPHCPPEPECPVEQEWTVSQQKDGKATIDLGDKYELQLNENKSQIVIINKETGEKTNIWGDPHVDWNGDGKTDANFWEKTTFQLEDGTKITIDTEKFKNNDMYVANDITITKGDKVIQVTGLSQNEKGDMQINQSDCGGQLMDMLVTDGFVVKENACGDGWINPETGEKATQEDFNVTKPGAEKPYEFCQEFGRSLGVFLMTGMLSWNWND